MKYGEFQNQGKEFVITHRDIERDWYNYIWNDSYIASVSHVGRGEGFSQDAMGNRISMVKDRQVYIAFENEYRNIFGVPVEKEYKNYKCVHAPGYTSISGEINGVAVNYTLFVPDDFEGEAAIISLKNLSSESKKMSIIPYYATNADGAYAPQGYNTGRAGVLDDETGVYSDCLTQFNGKRGYRYVYLASSQKVSGFDTAHNAFIGKYGNTHTPKALERGHLSNTIASAEKICFALKNDIVLEKNEEKKLVYVIGAADSVETAKKIKEKILWGDNAQKLLELVKNKFACHTDGAEIKTPDNDLNCLFNTWLKYETDMGSRWARVRHNGYRDMMSDTDCLSCINPTLALERYKRILTYQYSSGYAPRTFINGKINDNNFADNAVWIAFTGASIVKELGDISVLDEEVKYNDGSCGSIYEHIKRSVDFLFNFKGLYGLVKIWGGDWNDCLNRAGLEGIGVSVWLSIAWCRANKQFAELSLLKGCTEDYEKAMANEKMMEDAIDKYGWDGKYYLYGYNDIKEKIGSSECGEGSIHLIPQLWAVLADIGTPQKRSSAIKSAEKALNTKLGTRTLYPPYTKYNRYIGRLSDKPAGVHENAGIYLHTMCWKLAVDCILKDNKALESDLNKVLPFRNLELAGRAEPYVMCNCYFERESGKYALPGQSWRTAANGWLMKAIVNFIFGLKPEMEGLRIDPCLPESWKKCSISKKFRKAQYNIEYVNSRSILKDIFVDGAKICSDVLPYEDGKIYNVTVIIK